MNKCARHGRVRQPDTRVHPAGDRGVRLRSRPPGHGVPLPASPSTSPRRRRGDTRQRLLDAALDATEGDAFTNLSLRALTRRVGIVPTGFYRHFGDMDELGLALVKEAFGALDDMIRAVRMEPPDDMIRGAVAALAGHLERRPAHFRFILREIYGGSQPLRDAIRQRLDRFTDELRDELTRLPYVKEWSADDRHMFARLIVMMMVSTAADLIEWPQERDVITERTERQLRLVVLATPHWAP